MKSHVCKTALVILMLSFVSLLGCRTVVTDVNALLGTNESGENLGIPVNYNKDYVEVAYNASKPETEDIVSESEDEAKDDLEEINEDKSKDEDDKSERDADSKDDKESDNDLNESDDTKDNSENSDDDDLGNPDDEDTDKSEDETDAGEEVESEENEDDDLNASMASDNFDAEFYAATYPDVVAVFGNSPEALYKHYLDYGKAEGRSCNAEEYSLLNESSE